MKPKLIDSLWCTQCHESLQLLDHAEYSNGEIREGTLRCKACNKQYPIVRYIPRFVPNDGYVSSFSFEWTRWPEVLRGYESRHIFERFNIPNEELHDLRVLDAGCGSGGFLDIFSQHAREVVGIDLSNAVEPAMRLYGLRPNVNIIQGNLFNPPLRNAQFDLVYSFGVLMATPDTKKAFMSIAPLVKPNGKLAVYIYANRSVSGVWADKTKEQLSELYRKVTVKLPHRLLYILSYVGIPLDAMKHLPKIGRFVDATFESGGGSNWRMTVLQTFDWYSPKYQWKHTNSEVAEWFNEAGFSNLYISPSPVNIVGVRTGPA